MPLRLSEARARTCQQCGREFSVPYAGHVQPCCSRSCGRRLLAAAKAARRAAELVATMVTGAEVVEVPLSRGKVALVDARDVELVASRNWHAVSRGGNWYARDRTSLYMHHLLLPPQSGLEIDHVNGNGLDNRRSNIRYATRAQNRANQKRSTGASGVKGVFWHKRDRVWQARVAGRFLGYFRTRAEAAAAYRRAAEQKFGEYACSLDQTSE